MGWDDDEGVERYVFPPGEEPTVYTADLCAEVGHEHCEGITEMLKGMKANQCSASAGAIESSHKNQTEP
jgi:hypothetical protein